LPANGWRGAVYSKVAFPLFRRLRSVNPLVVYYHVVSDGKLPHIENLYSFRNSAQFEADLEVLLHYYRPLSLRDFLASLANETELPRDSFLLTFDDGLKQCYDVVAPILKRKGIPATFFLCSGFLDNKDLAYDLKKSLLANHLRAHKPGREQERRVRSVLEQAGIRRQDCATAVLSVKYGQKKSLDEISELLDYDFSAFLEKEQPYLSSTQVFELITLGHAIGSHSIDHPRYADLSLADQLHQTRESTRFVKERFSLKYSAFSFPHSDAEVSLDFFDEIFNQGTLDVCFGNRGLLEDPVSRNIQRTSMEKTYMSAEAILGKSYARAFGKSMAGQGLIQRPHNARETQSSIEICDLTVSK
jgi:peptidoglycan/xylan/chitin deacetylase (PgdA/CDA1 family)